MSDPRDSSRNPLVIPDVAPSAVVGRRCPRCKQSDFNGRIAGGSAVFTCRACGNVWQGGIGMEPARPTDPTPPRDPRDAPLVDFARNQRTGEIEEIRPRRPSTAPAFRGGAPIKGDDNDV